MINRYEVEMLDKGGVIKKVVVDKLIPSYFPLTLNLNASGREIVEQFNRSNATLELVLQRNCYYNDSEDFIHVFDDVVMEQCLYVYKCNMKSVEDLLYELADLASPYYVPISSMKEVVTSEGAVSTQTLIELGSEYSDYPEDYEF